MLTCKKNQFKQRNQCDQKLEKHQNTRKNGKHRFFVIIMTDLSTILRVRVCTDIKYTHSCPPRVVEYELFLSAFIDCVNSAFHKY